MECVFTWLVYGVCASIRPRTRLLHATGSVLAVAFELNGQKFVAINGGPEFTFNEAISFQIHCDTQEEIDDYWAKLTKGGKEVQCGWLKDRYGVSWQVIPTVLSDMLGDADREKANRAMKAMLEMVKFDIAELEAAYEGVEVGSRS